MIVSKVDTKVTFGTPAQWSVLRQSIPHTGIFLPLISPTRLPSSKILGIEIIGGLTLILLVRAEEPVVVAVLDGSVIKALLEDEDEFAMLAENLFTELDTDESGKLSKKELKPAILQLGVEQGVPPVTGVIFHSVSPMVA